MLKHRGFQPGQSGNPAGRPKGARNRTTLAAEAILEGEAEALTRKAIELALAGDVIALKLCLERLMPPRKERTVSFPLPPILSPADAQGAIGSILGAVASGNITPGEAASLVAVVQEYGKLVEPKASEPSGRPVIKVAFVDPPDRGPHDRVRLLTAPER
jgi:hypothetical protein